MSTITLYRTHLTPSKNALVDELSTYLAGCITYGPVEIQYQKPALDLAIKLTIPQAQLTRQDIGNYAALKQDDMTFYYFIMSAAWKSANTVEVTLSIDSINTFNGYIRFSEKTNVIREHRDRFTNIQAYTGSSMTLYKTVDNVDEGISPVLKMSLDSTISDTVAKSNQRWFLVYLTPDIPTSTSPVNCYLVPEKSNIYYQSSSSNITWKATDFITDTYYYWLRSDNSSIGAVNITTGSKTTSYSLSDVSGLVFCHTSGGFEVWTIAAFDGAEVKTVRFTPQSSLITLNEDSVVTWTQSAYIRKYSELTVDLSVIAKLTLYRHTSGTSRYIANIDTIDRTSSQLVKIIECPYCPIDLNFDSDYNLIVPDGFTIDATSMLKLTDINTEFSKTLDNSLSLPLTVLIPKMSVSDFTKYKRNDIYESKLYSSPFYMLKVTYDSYSMTLPLENIIVPENNPTTVVSIQYKQSNSMSSDLGFKIDSSNKLFYDHNSDHDLYILSSRNNESQIYTNAYLNYMRTGYNYDKKNATASTDQAIVGAAVSIAGAVVSAIAAVPTGGISLVAAASLATTAITNVSNAINTTVSNERNLNEKISSLKAQSSQVSGANDLDLLRWYDSNKLHKRVYRASNSVLKQVGDLFHYCGYATNEHKVPSLTSRYWFNYVQCNLDDANVDSNPILNNYVEDIKSRWSAGVTVYHCHDGEYDWDQQYEN